MMDLRTLLPTYSENQKQDEFLYKFTVFTPVYNRAKTVHRVFDSLKNQTFKDFELLIINDGSKDNSDEVILELIKTANFDVNYVNSKENKHKMARIVQALQLAKGEFFLPLDSDDECTEDALEVFYNSYLSIPDEKKLQISGLTCLCKDQHGNIVGDPFETSPYYSSTIKNMLDDKYNEEKWGFLKTNILKNIVVNPQLYSKGYIPEGVLWCYLSKLGYETYYFNSVLRVYYVDENDQNISSGSYRNNALGLGVYALCILNWFKGSFFKNPVLFLKWIYYLLLSSKYLPYPRKTFSKSIESPFFRLIFNIVWPIKKYVITRG